MKNKKIFLIIFIIISIIILLPFCKGHVDFLNKLSEKELENYIISELNSKYNKNFTVELISKEKIKFCGIEFWLDTEGCLNEYTIYGAYNYEFSIKSEDNLNAYVYYYDPYYYEYLNYQGETLEDNFKVVDDGAKKN